MNQAIDLIGQRFGRLKVISRSPQNSTDGKPMWLCVCECGQTKIALGKRLRKGGVTSCGCKRIDLARQKGVVRKKVFDLSGKVFGRLTVIALVDRKPGDPIYWQCACSCGKQCSVRSDCLRNGNTKSCGCLSYDARRRKGSKRPPETGERMRATKTAKREVKFASLPGTKFGRWTVKEYSRSDGYFHFMLCECAGTPEYPHPPRTKEVNVSSLLSGMSLSCGCLAAERHTKTTESLDLRRRFGSVKEAASKANISPSFLYQVSQGNLKCNKTYHRVRRYIMGDATPDGRRKRMQNCVGCNAAFLFSVAKMNRGEEPVCPNCVEFVSSGGRYKSLPLPVLMDAPKPPKERKRKFETVEIEKFVKEVSK